VVRRLAELDEPGFAHILVKLVRAVLRSRQIATFIPAAAAERMLRRNSACSRLFVIVMLDPCVQVVTTAMDRKDREREAASVLLATLHPKMISQVSQVPCMSSRLHPEQQFAARTAFISL
jgi:hypothetical protein